MRETSAHEVTDRNNDSQPALLNELGHIMAETVMVCNHVSDRA